MPLRAYQDFNAFKLFVLDVGLLGAMSELDIKSCALTEQYVLQQLIASREITPYYWSAEKASAKIDFISKVK